ncbi:MAG TPA: DUF4405 domain-containing protein [Planctomycetes bacterium]|nr:DUF4405 domain-containing protein [Planctomycetota bacterium]
MKKSQINLIIDVLLLVFMSAITGIGLLMRNVLVPGYKRWDIYGRNVELYFWGLDRHQWGSIHFVIALVLIALLVLHVVLHWSVILGIYRRLIPNVKAQWITAIILLAITIILSFFSYTVQPEVAEGGHRSQAVEHR